MQLAPAASDFLSALFEPVAAHSSGSVLFASWPCFPFFPSSPLEFSSLVVLARARVSTNTALHLLACCLSSSIQKEISLQSATAHRRHSDYSLNTARTSTGNLSLCSRRHRTLIVCRPSAAACMSLAVPVFLAALRNWHKQLSSASPIIDLFVLLILRTVDPCPAFLSSSSSDRPLFRKQPFHSIGAILPCQVSDQ